MVRVASINLAELLRSQGRAEEALTIYADYSKKNPADVLGTLNYAIALIDAGHGDEAGQVFMELLGRDDLTFDQWSEVGIGLYRAQNFAEASTAFQRAHEMRPLSKEILINLANTRYQQKDYERTIALADTLVHLYPYEIVNYNLLAASYRELARNDDALAVLRRRDALRFEFLQSQLASKGENKWVVQGQLMNRTVAVGSEITIPLELVGEDGSVLAGDSLHLEMPPEGEVTAFEVQLEASDPVAGFRYEAVPEVESGS